MLTIYGKGDFFKKDIDNTLSICPYCKQETLLVSYTAIQCLSLFGIPIFPLAKYRHLNCCPHCQKRLTYHFKDWKRVSKREMQTSSINYLNNTNRAEATIDLHQAYRIFKSKEKCEQLALKMEDKYHGNADVHKYLAKWYTDNKDYWKSIEHCEELYNMNVERIKQALILARLYFMVGDLKSSARYYQEEGLTLDKIDIKWLEHIYQKLSKKPESYST